MGKTTKICTKCKRGLPETAIRCSCGCTEIFNKKECDDILNKYHRSSEKEKYQMYQDEQYKKILDFVLSKEEIQTIIYNKNTSNRKYKSYVSTSSSISQPTPTPQNVPKCPTCGSTNIRRISTLNRAVSVGILGIFSGKIGKNYECLNCKAKW